MREEIRLLSNGNGIILAYRRDKMEIPEIGLLDHQVKIDKCCPTRIVTVNTPQALDDFGGGKPKTNLSCGTIFALIFALIYFVEKILAVFASMHRQRRRNVASHPIVRYRASPYIRIAS